MHCKYSPIGGTNQAIELLLSCYIMQEGSGMVILYISFTPPQFPLGMNPCMATTTGVLGQCNIQTAACIVKNPPPIMLLACYCHVIQYAGWFWEGQTADFLHHTTLISTLHEPMLATVCPGTLLQQQTMPIYHHSPTICEPNHVIWLLNAVLLLNSNTTYFLHTVLISTLHDFMP